MALERFCAPPSISAVASARAVSSSASSGATASARASFSVSVVLGRVAIVWSRGGLVFHSWVGGVLGMGRWGAY